MGWICPAGLWRSQALVDWTSIHPVRPMDHPWMAVICSVAVTAVDLGERALPPLHV
jgi:hypothetical protein